MALNTTSQIQQLILEAQHILICLPHEASIDDVAASSALVHALGSMNKTTTTVSEGFSQHPALDFLQEEKHTVHTTLPALHQLVVTLDISRAPLESLRYKVAEDNKLHIYLEPQSGTYQTEDTSVVSDSQKYDLIITLGAAARDSLGSYHKNETGFFTSTPLINIDHAAENERFGTVNLVNPAAAANCEVVYHLLEEMGAATPKPDFVARCLLTGILSKTSGLSHPNLSPNLITITKTLIERGADITKINAKLFHTIPLTRFKLWGRVLARLTEDESLSLIWSFVPHEDFVKTHTTPQDLTPIVQELITTYVQKDMVLLFWENQDHTISGSLTTNEKHNALSILATLNPTGRRDVAKFNLGPGTITEHQQRVLDLIRKRSV